MEAPVTITDVLSSWGISKDHPLFDRGKQYLLDQVLEASIGVFNSKPDDVVDLLEFDLDNISAGVADLTLMMVEQICEEADCKADARYIICATGKILSTVAEIGNNSEKFQIHESALGEAWEIIIQRLADNYGINVQQAFNTILD